MAIFDDELIDSSANRNPNPQLPGAVKPFLGSPKITDVDVRLPLRSGGGVFSNESIHNGLTIDQLSQVGLAAKSTRGFGSPMMMVPKQELLDNQRYGTYVRGVDLENVYSLTQPWYKQLGNGVAKFALTGVGTFAQSFATIPNTVAAVKTGKFSELSGEGGYESDIDLWLKNIEDRFPNYVSRWEKEHPYRSMVPFMRGSANFWGDKIIKNIGFTAGSIAGALVQDAAIGYLTGGLGTIPLIASQVGRASLFLNKILTGTNRLDKVLDVARGLGKSEKAIANLTSLARAAEATKLSNGFRYGMTLYGSTRTEAAVESRDAYRQVREELIKEYKSKNQGLDPQGADLDEIEAYATNAMNTRFGINLALLTASNTIQFGTLFKSFTNSAKGVPGTFTRNLNDAGRIGLTEGSLDVFEKKAVAGLAPKVWDAVKPTLKNVLAEGVYEEGGQFAAEKGTYDYFTRKYKNLKDPKNRETWNTLNEVVKSTNFGLAEQFGSAEGIENMLIGGITAVITGGISGKIERKLGKLSNDQRLQSAINVLNRYGLTGVLQNQYSDTLNSANIAREMEDAAKSGNVFKYKNLKHDQFFNFVTSRVPSGLHDVTVEQLNMLKDLDKEEFEKTFGMDFNESSKKTVNEYVDSLIRKANEIKDIHESVDFTFKNPFTSRINPQTLEEEKENDNFDTFNDWKTNLAYYASINSDVTERLNNIQNDLNKINPSLSNNTVSSLTNKDDLKETGSTYEEMAKSLSDTITEFTTPADKKSIRERIKTLRTMSERINLALNSGNLDLKTFEALLNFELSGQKSATDKMVPAEKIAEIYELSADINGLEQLKKDASDSFDNLSSEKGFNKFFDQAEEMVNEQDEQGVEEETKEEEEKEEEVSAPAPVEFINKSGAKETPEIDREYELEGSKLAKVKKIADDRYEVTSPYGETSFFSNKEDADQAVEDMNADVEDLRKVKVIGINEDGTIKVEDLKGNIQNISVGKLAGYEGIETEREKLAKSEEELKKQQAEIEKKSAQNPVEVDPQPIAPVPPTPTTSGGLTDPEEQEGKRKPADIMFISDTSEAQKIGVKSSNPRIERLRTFYDNKKFFKNRDNIYAILVTGKTQDALGLKGLAQISYGVELDKKLEDIPGESSIDDFLIMMLFVEIENGKMYFINANGERVGEYGKSLNEEDQKALVQKLVFGVLPTTALTYKDSSPKHREGEKELAKAYSKSWLQKRAEIFSSTTPLLKPYKFLISRGLARKSKNKDGSYKQNHVGDFLIKESKLATQQGLIIISEGSIQHQGRNITVKKGQSMFQYEDTLVFINNSKFPKTKATSLYHVIKNMVDEYRKTKKINPSYAAFIQNTLVYKEKYNGKNRFWMSGGFVEIGNEKFDMTKIDEFENKIVNLLSDTFQGTNQFTLKNNFSEPFTEYIFKDGSLQEITWRNYQQYLLASKYPDGTARSEKETPLTVSIEKPILENPYSFVQKYATLLNMDLPDIEIDGQSASISPTPTPSAPITAETQKIGNFEFNNGKENVFTGFNVGHIIFTGEIDDKGKIRVSLINNDTLRKIIIPTEEKDKIYSNELYKNAVVPLLKGLNLYDESASVQDNFINYITVQLTSKLETIRAQEKETAQQKAAPSTAATFTPTTPYGTPTGPEVTTATGAAPVSTDVKPKVVKIYHHTNVAPQDFNFGSFQRGKQQVSQFGDGLNASSTTTPFLVQRYGNPIEGEINDSDFIVIDANKSEKELYEELKAKGYKFNNPVTGSYIGNDPAKEYDGAEKANVQPAIISLFNDFQKSNPEVKGVKVINHIIVGQKVDPFYVIYDAKSFYGPGSLSKTQPSVSTDIKADIEKRRQEELKFTFGNNIEVISSGKLAVIERNVYFTPKYPKGANRISNREDAEKLVNEYKEINAKYDAELDALEGGKQQTTDAKADIERRRQEELESLFKKSVEEDADYYAENSGTTVSEYGTSKDFAESYISNKTFNKWLKEEGSDKDIDKPEVDKINAKYDEELAALEGAKVEEVSTVQEQEKLKELEELLTDAETLLREIEQEETDEKIDEAIEQELTPETVEELKTELKVETKEEVVDAVKDAVKKDFKKNGVKIVNPRGKSTLLRKIVNKIKKVILSFLLLGTLYGSYSFTNKYNVEDVENFATRLLVKHGLYTPEEDKLVIKQEVAKPIVAKTDSVYEKKITKFEKLNQDKTGIWSYRNQWLNKNGFVYVAGVNNKNFVEQGKPIYKGVEGVAHHLIMLSEAGDLTKFTTDKDLKSISEQVLSSAKRNNEYVPVVKRLGDGKVKITYKLGSEVSEGELTPIKLRQTKVSDLDFNTKAEAEGFKKSVHSVYQKSTKQGFNSLVYIDKNSYGKFSGGAIVLLFKDKKGNLIVREYSGSINGIVNEINLVKGEFGVTDNDITLGVYDAGSYTGKVGAIEGVVNPERYKGYNPTEKAGSSLMIPTQEKSEQQIASIGLLSLLGLMRRKRKEGVKVTSDEINQLREEIASLKESIASIKESISKKGTQIPQAPYKPTEEQKPFNANDVLPPNSDYRLLAQREETEPKITQADLDIFKTWTAENVPTIPYEILDNVITINSSEKAWGVWEEGVAKFYRGAIRGTEYHEIFEGIWKAFLSPEQREAIIDELRVSGKSFKDRFSDKILEYSTATDKQIKERIADDFAEFRLGKLPAKTLGEKILRFFKNIIEFFKKFVQKPSLKKELFESIDRGKFKKFIIPEDVKRDYNPEYSRIPGLTPTQVFYTVQDMTARMGYFLFGTKKSLFDISKITAKEIFDKIEIDYIKEGRRKELTDETWAQLVERTKQKAYTLGIKFDEDDRVNVNNDEKNSKDYAPEPFSVNWKENSPFAVRFLISSVIETEPSKSSNFDGTLDLPPASLSKKEEGGVFGLKILNRGRVFSTLMRNLGNTTDAKKFVSKLANLARNDGSYVRLFKNLGAKQIISGDGKKMVVGELSFEDFKPEDWRLFVNMMDVFTKQNPTPYIQYTTKDQTYTSSVDTSKAQEILLNRWFENMKLLSEDSDSIILKDKVEKLYKVNKSKLPKNVPNTPLLMIEFLDKIGIEFEMSVYTSLKDKDVKKFTESVAAIYKYIETEAKIYTLSGETLGIENRIKELSRMYIDVTNPSEELVTVGIKGGAYQKYTNHNYPSKFNVDFNDSKTIDELKENRKELNDVFATNSVILKKGGRFVNDDGEIIKKLELSYIQGNSDYFGDVETETSQLSPGARITQELNQNLSGRYSVLVNADSSSQWLANLGNEISFNEVIFNKVYGRVFEIFRGYLEDEIALAKSDRKHLVNVGKRAKELRFFKDILPTDIVNQLHKMIEDGKTDVDIKAYIDKNINKINESIKEFIEETIDETQAYLKSTGEISENSDGSFTYSDLDTDFTSAQKIAGIEINRNNINKETFTNILRFANINYVINNIEFHKVFFGDPYQFKIDKDGNLDELKRIKSFLSPRRLVIDFPEFNTSLNDIYNKAGDVELSPDDVGYHLFKDHARTITFRDVEYKTDKYSKVNEADAQSWIIDGAYREVKIKNGQWPTEAETWHQWQMAYTRRALSTLNLYKYSSEALMKHDEKLLKTPEPKYVTDVMKPIVTGLKQGVTNIEMVLDKFSQAPLYYKFYENKNLGELYIKMFKEKVDYAIMESGRKEGITELNDMYDEEGYFNKTPFKGFINVSWKSYGTQVETGYDKPKDQTRGSQPTKIVSMDLFEYGKSITADEDGENARNLYNQQKELLDRIHENGYVQLFDSLGMEDLGGGNYNLKYKELLSQTLKQELLKREVSEKTKDTIEIDKETNDFLIPFEASNSYKKIKDIIYSMVVKSITSPKVNGGQRTMISSTLFEKSNEKRNSKAPNPVCKFYTKDDPYMEIWLPHWFRNKFNKKRFPTDEAILKYLNSTEEGQSILRGIGFRIPTQGMASIEVFRVKGFLSQSQGDSVIVASEMVAKTNADFDHDKLNTYLKSVYIDERGDVRLVKLLDTEEETKEFYGKIFDKKVEKATIKKNDLFALLQNRILEESGFTNSEDEIEAVAELEERVGDTLDAILEDVDDVSAYEETLIKELNKLGDKNLQGALRKKYVDTMYKKALENAYYDVLIKILTLPQNFERLLSPIDDAGLKSMATEMDKLTNSNVNKKGQLLNRKEMSFIRHAFVSAKKWIGIVATNITGHSLSQIANLYIKNISDWVGVSDFDRKMLGDGVIYMPHNTTEVNGNTVSSLAGRKTIDGLQFISDRLSGYATSLVDVAKDPYIIKIIATKKILEVAMFMERLGMGKKTVYFLNQPIIREYVKLLNSRKKQSRIFSSAEIEEIVDRFGSTSAEAFDADTLESNITDYYSEKGLSETQNAEQVRIFYEFLKYAKMANISFKFTQAINYDTTKFKDSDSLFKKELRTEEASRNSIISSVEKVMDSTFLGKQAYYLSKIMDAIGSSIFKLDGGELSMITREVLEPYAKKDFMYEDDYNQISEKIKQSFLDYIIQVNSDLNNEIYNLFVNNETNVANKLLQAKEMYPELRILKDLQVVTSDVVDNPTKSIRLAVDTKDPFDEDVYTELMRQLRDNPDTRDLYYDLVMVSILQGTAASPISIKNIIPIEDYSEIIKPIIENLSVTEDIKAFSKTGAFQRNNWKDDRIVPIFQPRYTVLTDERGEEILLTIDPYTDEDIYMYGFKGFNVEGLSNDKNKRVLLVNQKYLSMENRSAIESDYIKIPFIVTVNKKTGEKVHTKRNTNMTGSNWAELIKGKHPDLNGYYGYKKLKYSNGDAVLTKKGEYVYKLINLYGDGNLVTEHHVAPQKSVLNNGTEKVERELTDDEILRVMGPSLSTPEEIKEKQIVQFNKLPKKSATPTMTYAGIGSREAPVEVLKQMTEAAEYLEGIGYTLNTGKTYPAKPSSDPKYQAQYEERLAFSKKHNGKVGLDEEGADRAFSLGATKKNLFSPGKQGSRAKEQTIAKEIHPNPGALSQGALKLMARNTNQIFGDNLDTPVDFVLFYAKETGGIRPEGGTGQAVEMARRKGIPTINMADSNWRQLLQDVISKPTAPRAPVSKIVANIPQNKVSGVESYGSLVTAAPNVIAALGSSPYSIDMIEAGFRTRTTRSADEMAKYNVKVGDIIKHFGKSADGTTKEILARVTAIHPKGSAGWKGTWAKEGWKMEDVNIIDRFKDGAAAIEFEVIKPTTITLKDDKTYNVSDVNTKMLTSMGYSLEEAGKIIKQIC